MTFSVEILPGLWLTDHTSHSKLFYQEKNIRLIINSNLDMEFFGRSQEYVNDIKVELEKYEIQKMHQYLVEKTELIHQYLYSGKNVLVYDRYATLGGALILICYLIRYGHMNLTQAVSAFKSKLSFPIKIAGLYSFSLQIFERKVINSLH